MIVEVVNSFVYSARRPFHPLRCFGRLSEDWNGVLRSKGFFGFGSPTKSTVCPPQACSVAAPPVRKPRHDPYRGLANLPPDTFVGMLIRIPDRSTAERSAEIKTTLAYSRPRWSFPFAFPLGLASSDAVRPAQSCQF